MNFHALKSAAPTSIFIMVGVGLIGAILAFLFFDVFSSLTTLKVTRTDSAGVILSTSYHPLAFAAPLVLALVGTAGVGFTIWQGSTDSKVSAARVASASLKLDGELQKVMRLILSHLGTSDTYAKSLASAQNRMTALNEPKQVAALLKLLVVENERMRVDTTDLKDKLQEAKSQVENLRASLSQAQEIGLKDALTTVGNRRYFDESLEKEIVKVGASRTPLSLILCDIDNFKKINDTHGHAVGDEVLKMFARLLADGVRDGDTVARIGGEEFAITLPQATQANAQSLAERLRRQCATRQLTLRNTNEKLGSVTASFGVAQLRDGESSASLVDRADAKLYEAKSGGRNKVAI